MNRIVHRVRDCRGVSLMEMMIITVIIGVMSAMAVPQWLKALPRMRAQSAAREVVSALRIARSESIARKEPFGINFDVSNNVYETFINRNNPAAATYTPGDSLVDSMLVYQDAKIASQTFPTSAVVFNPDGSASSSGVVNLIAKDSCVVFTIDVLASTGRIRMTESPGPSN
ncbi:MAG: GspH/FimT family pseudopilin [Candidatus Zixiibacteriota bacterium]